jgi:hypothetical protein
MRFGLPYAFKARATVGGVVETAVAMGTTVLVTVLFVALLVFPDVAAAATAPTALEVAVILGLRPATA